MRQEVATEMRELLEQMEKNYKVSDSGSPAAVC